MEPEVSLQRMRREGMRKRDAVKRRKRKRISEHGAEVVAQKKERNGSGGRRVRGGKRTK